MKTTQFCLGAPVPNKRAEHPGEDFVPVSFGSSRSTSLKARIRQLAAQEA